MPITVHHWLLNKLRSTVHQIRLDDLIQTYRNPIGQDDLILVSQNVYTFRLKT